MLCRSAERAGEALERIAKALPQQAEQGLLPMIFIADLADTRQVLETGREIASRYPCIHLLINNAGFMAYPKLKHNNQGVESTAAVNHLGHYALTCTLRESLLRAGRGARIINVSSGVHRLPAARFSIEDIGFEQGYSPMLAYARSKLMNVLFTRELAVRLQDLGITANSLHPGVVYTGIARSWPNWFQRLHRAGRFFMINAEKGAQTSLYLATSTQVEGVSGQYFVRCKPAASASWPGEPALRHQLWDWSAEQIGISADWL